MSVLALTSEPGPEPPPDLRVVCVNGALHVDGQDRVVAGLLVDTATVDGCEFWTLDRAITFAMPWGQPLLMCPGRVQIGAPDFVTGYSRLPTAIEWDIKEDWCRHQVRQADVILRASVAEATAAAQLLDTLRQLDGDDDQAAEVLARLLADLLAPTP